MRGEFKRELPPKKKERAVRKKVGVSVIPKKKRSTHEYYIMVLSCTTHTRAQDTRFGRKDARTTTYWNHRRTFTYGNSPRGRSTRPSGKYNCPHPPSHATAGVWGYWNNHGNVPGVMFKCRLVRPAPLLPVWDSRSRRRVSVPAVQIKRGSHGGKGPAHDLLGTSSHSRAGARREGSRSSKYHDVEMEDWDLRRLAILNWARQFPFVKRIARPARTIQVREEHLCPEHILYKKIL